MLDMMKEKKNRQMKVKIKDEADCQHKQQDNCFMILGKSDGKTANYASRILLEMFDVSALI